MSRLRPLHLLVLLVVCASWACEKVPLTSPTGSTISLSTNSNIVPINGSVEVTATVTESAGTAVQNGTTVVFTSDFGRMDPAEAQTQNGRAKVRFVAGGQSGTVKVNAFSGGATTSGGTTSGALTLLVGGAAAGRIVVRAEPPTIPQGGGTIQIYANVADTNGNPLAGAPVTFTIGGTTGTGILGSPSTVTDANGQAQTSLTTTQTTTVTATIATTTTASVTANVVVSLLPAPTVALACPATPAPAVGVAVTCTVTPTIPTGGSAIQNVTVNWGDGSGEQPAGNVTGATVVSHTYSSPNTYTVTASATDINGQRGTAVATVVVQRTLPTIVITCPTAAQFTRVPIPFTVAPPATSAIPISNVTVDFGDGTTRNLGQITGPTGFTKAYTTAGGYSVTFTVTDTSGQRGSSACAVIVNASQPSVTLTHTTFPASAGTVETFSVSGSVVIGAPPITNITVIKLDTGLTVYSGAGNGTFPVLVGASGTTFTLEATATDAAGETGRTSLVVTVP